MENLLGKVVRWKDANEEERDETHLVIEDNGDRCIISDLNAFWDKRTIRPSMATAKSNLEVIPEGEIAARDREFAAHWNSLREQDRYAQSREAFGITLPACGPKDYLIYTTPADFDGNFERCFYRRFSAADLGEALMMAEREDAGKLDASYAILPEDYAEARQLGINFFENDGNLL